MNFLRLLCLYLFLFSNLGLVEAKLSKPDILEKSNECFEDSKKQACKNLILQLEQMQLLEFKQNKFKCQSSILGLQTELIEANFFTNVSKRSYGITIPYVIKNC